MQQGNSARPAGSMPFGSPFDRTPALSGNANGAAALLSRLQPQNSTGVSRQPLSPTGFAAEGLLQICCWHSNGDMPLAPHLICSETLLSWLLPCLHLT